MKDNNLSTEPVLNKPKKTSPKLLSPEETPLRLSGLMDVMRSQGQKAAEGHYNLIVKTIGNVVDELSVQDTLSLMTTFLTYYASTWIVLMKRIADMDDSCIDIDEMIQALLEGVEAIVKTAKIKE